MIVPVSDVTCNDETVGDYKLNENECTNYSNKVCLFVRFTRFVAKCFCPYSP